MSTDLTKIARGPSGAWRGLSELGTALILLSWVFGPVSWHLQETDPFAILKVLGLELGALIFASRIGRLFSLEKDERELAMLMVLFLLVPIIVGIVLVLGLFRDRRYWVIAGWQLGTRAAGKLFVFSRPQDPERWDDAERIARQDEDLRKQVYESRLKGDIDAKMAWRLPWFCLVAALLLLLIFGAMALIEVGLQSMGVPFLLQMPADRDIPIFWGALVFLVMARARRSGKFDSALP